jgi:hypothetical protein
MDISRRIRRGRYAAGTSAGARQNFWSTGDRKQKSDSRTAIWRCPQSTVMTLDYGPTDGETDSHTVTLGCVERFEEPVRILKGKSDSRILHHQTHMIVFVSFGFDD